jgi:hypothetical protein
VPPGSAPGPLLRENFLAALDLARQRKLCHLTWNPVIEPRYLRDLLQPVAHGVHVLPQCRGGCPCALLARDECFERGEKLRAVLRVELAKRCEDAAREGAHLGGVRVGENRPRDAELRIAHNRGTATRVAARTVARPRASARDATCQPRGAHRL